MKSIIIFLFLIPSFLISGNNDSTIIKLKNIRFDSTIAPNKSYLNVRFFSPDGKSESSNDVVLIANTDTFCFNSILNKDTIINLPSGEIFFEVRSKWWQSTKTYINLESQSHTNANINFAYKILSLPQIDYDYNKPVIYFYPKNEQEIHAKLNLKGKLGFTYPMYKNGWSFTAKPNGDLKINNKHYKYLFWEGTVKPENSKFDNTRGFIINSDTLIDFFEKTLSKIGLSSAEQQDFITYWYPIMKVNETNYIHFIFNEEYNHIASLKVTPKPDSIIRLFMFWKKSDYNESINISAQTLPKIDRKGFTIVEWGGSKIPENALSFSK